MQRGGLGGRVCWDSCHDELSGPDTEVRSYYKGEYEMKERNARGLGKTELAS